MLDPTLDTYHSIFAYLCIWDFGRSVGQIRVSNPDGRLGLGFQTQIVAALRYIYMATFQLNAPQTRLI